MIQLFIKGQELDVSQDINFPLTYQQADAKHPEKRKRDASKTIVLPGTTRNNSFFSSAYDLNISDVYGDLIGFDFDPALRYDCIALRNGTPCFRGSAHLQSVFTRSDVTNGRVNEFSVVLYSSVADIFQALADLKVSELGWSAYDETLSVANIVASWTAGTGSGIFWPYIDYGYADNPQEILTNQLIPYAYVIEIIEKCLAVGGFTLDSTFLNTSNMLKLVWGSSGGEQITITSAEATARQANHTGDGSTSWNFNSSFSFGSITQFHHLLSIPIADGSILTMTEVTDPTSQYNETTGIFVAAYAGNYNQEIAGTFPITYTYSDTGLTGQNITITVTVRTFLNGALINSTPYTIIDGAAGSDSAVFAINQELDLSAGDIVYSDIQISTFGSSVSGLHPTETLDVTFDFNNTLDVDYTAINTALVDGDTVRLARFLPNMKASEFFLDMITMFNLYVSDPDENKTITIEPAQDGYFYDADDVDIWSDKLDRSSGVDIQPVPNIEGKVYRFRFAEDRDYYKKLYFDQKGIDYGDYNYDVPSTFKKGEKVYQLKTAQSCPVELEGTDIIIPRIYQQNETTLVRTPHKGKPRIFFNNGTTATADGWDLINSDTLAASAQSVYPVCHHLDDLTTPTIDLNFGRPEFVFYTATAYTTNTLFAAYYGDFIRELTGRDSKLVNAWFKLNESDFYENFMRRFCNIDGVLYKKNVVKDWLANSNSLVKVELLKVVVGKSTPGVYSGSMETGTLPILFPVGDPTQPIDSDTTAQTTRGFYPVDTSSGDVTLTLDGRNLRAGWTGEFSLIDATNNLILVPTGDQPLPTLSGSTSLTVSNQWDAPQIRWDGANFYLK